MVSLDKLAFLDIETSGPQPQSHEIIEVGVVLVDNEQVVQEWSTLVQPTGKVDPFIFQLTGISPASLVSAPTFEQIAQQLQELLADRVLVAHNVRFDYSFLRSAYASLEQQFVMPHLCSLRLARAVFPRLSKYGLTALKETLGLPEPINHRALPDAVTLWHLWQKSQTIKAYDELLAIARSLVSHPSLPPRIQELTQLQQLPETPGVYLFFDERHFPLYVGKSVNIKSRVLSHFYDDLGSSKELLLKDQVAAIETIETAGEIEALLLESQLVKELQPVFNHHLRRHTGYWTWKLYENPEGYLTIKTVSQHQITYRDVPETVAVFRSKKQAIGALQQLCSDATLCQRYLGLEKTSGACFKYHLGECFGACVNEEAPTSYNERLTKALQKFQLKPWVYDQPQIVTEVHPVTGKAVSHVVDHWCYFGQLDPLDPPATMIQKHLDHTVFDLDTYKILTKFIA